MGIPMDDRAGKTRVAERQGAKWNKSVDVVQLRRGEAYNMVWYLVPYLGIAKGTQANVPNNLVKLAWVVRRA